MHTKDIPEDVLNTYCWIHSTYTLKSLYKKKAGTEVPYPGVGNSEGKEIDRKVYKYYQWVCFCLFFQVSVAGDRAGGQAGRQLLFNAAVMVECEACSRFVPRLLLSGVAKPPRDTTINTSIARV